MYCPASFRTTPEEDLKLIYDFPLATLVVDSPMHGLVSNQLPLFASQQSRVDGQLVLVGHCARKNPLAEMLRYGTNCLVVFNGESHYVSPSFMDTEENVVPTYNYVTLQLQGFATLREDEQFLREATAYLTLQEESKYVPNNIWKPDEPSVKPRLAHIVGFQIVCRTKHGGKNKNSQNKSEAIQKSIASHFQKKPKKRYLLAVAAPALVIGLIVGYFVASQSK